MLRKLLVASMLTLSLSACAPADASAFDYSTTFRETNLGALYQAIQTRQGLSL